MNAKRLKVLVIRFSSIGDIVLTTPIVRCLSEQIGAEVHFLTKKSFASILEANPFLTKVHTIDDKVREVMDDLRDEAFDMVIDLHQNIRSFRVKRGLQVASYTFNKINIAKWLRVNLKIDRLPDRHIVERYFDTVKPIGVYPDDKGLDYFIPSGEEVDLNQVASNWGVSNSDWLAKLRAGRYIGLVIGAAHATKRLPKHQLIALARQLPKPIVLLGGPGDREAGLAIASEVEGVVNTCGQFSLHGSASLVKQCTHLITHDTGLMHIGAAFRRKMSVVWGNTIPRFGMYPYLPLQEEIYQNFEVVGLGCRPCSKIGFSECPKGHFKCMEHHDLAKIGAQAVLFLAQA